MFLSLGPPHLRHFPALSFATRDLFASRFNSARQEKQFFLARRSISPPHLIHFPALYLLSFSRFINPFNSARQLEQVFVC